MILHVPFLIMQQIFHYAHAALPNEVTGIGTIKQIGPSDFLVTEVFLPHQKTNPGFSEFDDGALNNIITDLIAEDPKRASDLRFRWHSHAKGQVFWSGTDNADIAEWQAPWVVNLVVNALSNSLARFDMFNPFLITNYPLEVMVDYDYDMELKKKCFQEVAERVKPLPIGRSYAIDPRKVCKEDDHVQLQRSGKDF